MQGAAFQQDDEVSIQLQKCNCDISSFPLGHVTNLTDESCCSTAELPEFLSEVVAFESGERLRLLGYQHSCGF